MVLKLRDRFMVVLNRQELEMVREVLQEKIRQVVYSDVSNLSEDEVERINREYQDLGDLRAKFTGAYVIED